MTEELKSDATELPEPMEIDYSAEAGIPLGENIKKASKEDIIGALKSVQDPELILNVFDL